MKGDGKGGREETRGRAAPLTVNGKRMESLPGCRENPVSPLGGCLPRKNSAFSSILLLRSQYF